VRVSAGRIDLKSMTIGRPCIIITLEGAVRISQPGGTDITVSSRLAGEQDDVIATGDGVYWLNLASLRPRRIYRLTLLTAPEGMPSWELKDLTPGTSDEWQGT
jgi:hypothetical protein